MPASRALTPIAVLLLALLHEDDMHPYEMIRLMRARREDRLVTITNGTVYHTVSRLEAAGLIEQLGVDRDGNRPERTTYAVTDAGREHMRAWLRAELVRIDSEGEFRVALAEAHNLERADVHALLSERRAVLEAQFREHRAGLTLARKKGVPEQYLVEIARADALQAAELAWLDTVLTDLRDDNVTWGVHDERAPYATEQREAARQ